MKHKLLVYLLLAFFTFPLFAQETDLESKYETIENNLIAGVKSDNLGLRVSAAYFLGEINSNRAVIPLMHMLKNSDIEEERLVAALSLAKIKSEKGMFAVKQRIKFDDSERVQRMCQIFYNDYLFHNIEGNVIVEPFEIADVNLEYKGIKLEKFLN